MRLKYEPASEPLQVHEGITRSPLTPLLACTPPSGEKPLRTRATRNACRAGRFRCRANMAHVRQSGPEFGLGFQVNALKTFQVVPSSSSLLLSSLESCDTKVYEPRSRCSLFARQVLAGMARGG